MLLTQKQKIFQQTKSYKLQIITITFFTPSETHSDMCLSFFCSFSDKYSDMFFIPSLLLNAGFFSIFSIVRINRILCVASIWSPHLYSVFCWYCHYNKFIFHNTHLPWGIASLYFSNFENSVFIFLCTNCFLSMLTLLQ